MPETAKITQIGDSTPTRPEQPQENGKTQLPGESQLWYNRYCLYRDLGHKRSLRAAVAKEREALCLVKEQPAATKSTPQKKVTAKSGKKANIVPPPEAVAAINVPGSWKNAAKVYHWSERAQSFDTWLIREMTRLTYISMGASYANKYKRVQLLDLLIKSSAEQFNDLVKKGTSCKNYLDFVKQIAALAKQMEDEMKQITEDEMKAAVTAYAYAIQDEMEKAVQAGQTSVTRKA